MNDAPAHHVLCIGNAMVDMLARCDDAFLDRHEIIKGAMNLVDATRSAKLYDAMGPSETMSGGSAGNTAAAIAALGGSVAYIGKVANDQLGAIFGHDIRALGARFETSPLLDGDPTARCMIFVTPDGERSMNTYLGACTELTEADIAEDVVRACAITYFEGYLWDPPHAKAAIRKAATLAHEHGRQVAISLSDPFCVTRYRDEFLELLRGRTVDIVFANETELCSLYETDDFDSALEQLAEDCLLATRDARAARLRRRPERDPSRRARLYGGGAARHDRRRRPLCRRLSVRTDERPGAGGERGTRQFLRRRDHRADGAPASNRPRRTGEGRRQAIEPPLPAQSRRRRRNGKGRALPPGLVAPQQRGFRRRVA